MIALLGVMSITSNKGKRAEQECENRCDPQEGVPEEVRGDSDQLLNGDIVSHMTEVSS